MNRVVSIAGAWDAPELVAQRKAAKARADSMLCLGAIGLLAIVALMGVLNWYEHGLLQDCLKHHAEAECVQYE